MAKIWSCKIKLKKRHNKKSFRVRCIYKWPLRPDIRKKHLYEERITLWKAVNIDESIKFAEEEAELYAKEIDAEYLGIAQAYHMFEEIDLSVIEAFSLLRDSDLEPDDYLDTFYDTGNERQK